MANSANIRIKGDSTITWGSSTCTGLGILVSGTQKHTGDKVTITDEDGNVIAVIEFINQTTVVLPLRGDTIVICSAISALVDDYDIKWERGKEQMISLRATFYKFLVTS